MGEPCAAAAARQVWRYLRQFPSPCSPNRSLLRQAARGSPHPSRPTGLWQISRSCGYFLFLRPAPTPVINVQKQGGCSTSAKCYRPLDASRASLQILPPPVRLPFWTGFFAGTESGKKRPLPKQGHLPGTCGQRQTSGQNGGKHPEDQYGSSHHRT